MKTEKEKRSNPIYLAISTIPMKAIFIAKVLWIKWPAYVCASGLSGILCLLEPRIPNNGLVVKYSHKSNQESSEAWTILFSSSTQLKTYCELRMMLVTALAPEAHWQNLGISPWGLHLDPHVPAEALTGLDDKLGPSSKGEQVWTSSCIHTLGQPFT